MEVAITLMSNFSDNNFRQPIRKTTNKRHLCFPKKMRHTGVVICVISNKSKIQQRFLKLAVVSYRSPKSQNAFLGP